MRPVALILASLAALVLGGCGAAGAVPSDQAETLVLAGPPGAIDAGVYLATERGYDEADGLRLTVQAPGGRDAGVRLLRSAGAGAAFLRLDELARARERGADVVGVLALVQRPLHPRAGEPPAPGVVLAVTRTTLEDDRGTVTALIQVLQRGYEETQVDPDSAVQAIASAVPGADVAKLSARLGAIAPAFTEGVPAFGVLRRAPLRAWAAWARRRGIVHRPLDVGRAFAFGLVGPSSRD